MKIEIFKTNRTIANDSEAMNANNVSKNCRNLKRQKSMRFFNYLTFVGCIFTALFLFSCAAPRNQLKGDVIGFSDDVYPATFKTKRCIVPYIREKGKPIDLQTNKSQMQSKILTLSSGTNAAAYKALEVGLNRVKNVKKRHMAKSINTKYYVLFFTDGKDNVSATDERSYAKYDKKIQRKMKRTMGMFNRKNSFQSFALLFEGPDLQKDKYTSDQLTTLLTPFTGSQNADRPKVIHSQNIDEILKKFEEEFTSQSFSFYIPKGYSGKKVNMILRDDDYTFEKNEKGELEPNDKLAVNKDHFVSFDGDFVKKGLFCKKYYLKNISTSNNFKFEMDPKGIKMDVSTNKKSNRINFQIKGLKKDGNLFVPVADKLRITQQYMDMGSYRFNSEYIPDAGQIDDAYVLAIIDTSESLGEETNKAKDMMVDAINIIVAPKTNKKDNEK
jgi:hypothetical protein